MNKSLKYAQTIVSKGYRTVTSEANLTMDGDEMRRGNFFRRNQYKIAAACVLAAVLGLTGMYVFRGRQSGEEKQQSVAENSDKTEKQQVAKAKEEATKKTVKKAETKTEEKETEQTARVSAIVKPKQYEAKEEAKTDSAGSKNDNKTAAQAGGAEQAEQTGQAGQEEQPEQAAQPEQTKQKKKKKTSETGSTKAAVPAELHFNEKDGLLWPVDGAVILDYSMDHTVYFTTLDQYKYNPAIIISGNVNDKVKAAANGKITDISVNEVTGCTVTMDIGDGYTAIYGQLKEVPYKKGAYLEAGDSLGFVSEPTKYYSLEGSNLYFALEKDGVPVDPVELFASDIEE